MLYRIVIYDYIEVMIMFLFIIERVYIRLLLWIGVRSKWVV